jgi:Leucine-rich repeat (LRR) protein
MKKGEYKLPLFTEIYLKNNSLKKVPLCMNKMKSLKSIDVKGNKILNKR